MTGENQSSSNQSKPLITAKFMSVFGMNAMTGRFRLFQYTSQAYFKLTKSYGIIPSMSRRGNPYDNALAENFFLF